LFFTLVRSKLEYITVLKFCYLFWCWQIRTHSSEICSPPFRFFLLCPLQLCLCFRVLEIAHITWGGITFIDPLVLFCPSLLETAVCHVASQYSRDYSRFSTYSSINYPLP
jgi:hypothetical protein